MSDVLTRLFDLEQFGVKLGLDNMRVLVEVLGHPERAYSTVLVAGTNGKGSVTAMVDRALRAAGRRTGRYTSPHLVRLEERFVIDGRPAGIGEVEDAARLVLDVEAACRADGRLAASATFFEVTTAIAFELFRRAAVDVAVLEVGLGGRFDATNISAPIVTAIVSIDVDHTKHLGANLADIAFEKAGILREGVPAVIGELPRAALQVVERVAEERGARISHAAEGVACEVAELRGGSDVRIETPTRTYGPLTLALAGRHQVGNALVAVRLLEELDNLGIEVSREAIETGLRDARWPCRLERVPLVSGRELLLDAAHNPAGARALAEYIRAEWPAGLLLVYSASGDKDAAGMLDALAPVVSDVIVTEIAGTRRTPLAELTAIAEARMPGRVRAIADARAALDTALSETSTVCVAGSIFLLGELLPYVDSLRAGSGPVGGPMG